jgi:putative peptidoglycan lipid II flippase
VGLLALGDPIVRLLFQRGEFGAAEAMATSQALAGYAVGLPAFSATRLAAQTFYALGDTRTPVRVGFLTLAVNVAFALLLMEPLRHAGLALASSLASYASLLALGWLLRRRLGPLGGAGLTRSLARTLGASVPLLLWCLWLHPGAAGTWRSAAWTLGTLGGGAVIYAATAALLRAPELTSLLGLLRRRGENLPSTGSG